GAGGGVPEGCERGQVGDEQPDVHADDGVRDHLGGGGGPFHHCSPVVQVRRAGHQAEPVADDLVEPTVVELEGHLVDVRGVGCRDHRPGLHVTEETHFATHGLVDLTVGADDDHVG